MTEIDCSHQEFVVTTDINNYSFMFVPPPEASGTAVRVGRGEPEPAAGRADPVQEAFHPAGLQSDPRSLSHNQGRQRKPAAQRPGPGIHRQPLCRTGLSALQEGLHPIYRKPALTVIA